MKRSDMVISLAISLMTRLPEWEKQERLKFADELLSDLEIEGMLPPFRKATVKDYANLGFDQEFLDEHEFTVNRWDDEDEEE
jgi:hypothetical protein